MDQQIGPAAEDVAAELDLILASRNFESAVQLRNFLRYVVSETLADRSDQIKQYTVAVNAFGRASDFDPEVDPIVRITAHRLRRALTEYYATDGAADPIRIEIPKGAYVPAFHRRGGVGYEPNDSARGVVVSDSLLASPQRTSSDLPLVPSIGILPFENFGGGAEHAYLATGLTDRIALALTYFPQFVVVGPLWLERADRGRLDPRQVGREFDVRFLLDGHLRRYNTHVRIHVKLLDTTTGAHLWANAYEYSEDYASLAEFEDVVSSNVAATIAAGHGVVVRKLQQDLFSRPHHSSSGYGAMLRFHHAMSVLSREAYKGSIDSLTTALEAEPEDALLLAMLAGIYLQTYLQSMDDLTIGIDRAEDMARRAVGLDPNCVTAHMMLGTAHYLRGRPAALIREVEAAIALNPRNAGLIGAASNFVAVAGEYDRSRRMVRQALQLSQYYPASFKFTDFWCDFCEGDFEGALSTCDEFASSVYIGPLMRAAVLGHLDRPEEARYELDRALEFWPELGHRPIEVLRRAFVSEENVERLLNGFGSVGWPSSRGGTDA